MNGQHPGIISRAEWAVALGLTILIICAHVAQMFHVGALWRDEVNTYNLVTLPTLGSFWSALEFDSFPSLWPLALRAWIGNGWCASDLGLRMLGLLVGLCVLATLWWDARTINRGLPFASLLLFGANPTLIQWGDSVRAYGAGVLLSLLTFGAIWNFVKQSTWPRFAFAALCAVLSVQSLYYNSILLLVLCLSGSAVGVYRRDWKLPATLLGLGFCCALSLLPYWSNVAGTHDWGRLVKIPVTLFWLLERFREALAPLGIFMLIAWIGLAVSALLVCILRLCFSVNVAGPNRELSLFLGTAILFSVVFYFAFLKALSYPTQPWYYVSLMAFLAVALDAALQLSPVAGSSVRIGRLAAVLVAAFFMAGPVWRSTQLLRTNVDQLAATLEREAKEDDLIVVSYWCAGITFDRYYQGGARWMTLPDINDHRLHRYDLVQAKMIESRPLKALFETIAETLRSGNRVWILGPLPAEPDSAPEPFPPAPHPESGWKEVPYYTNWLDQLSYFLHTHAESIEKVSNGLPSTQIMIYENLSLAVAVGRRSEADASPSQEFP